MNSILKAHILKKELDNLRPISHEQEQIIMQKFRLDWNYHSNNLEGNSLTYGETKALILFGITAQGKPLKDHFEITGHDEAIKYVEEVVRNERPLTEMFIRELHTLLLKERYQVDAITTDGTPTKKWIEVGVYKSSPNHVKTKTGEIFRFANPEETPALMNDLMDWYKSEKGRGDVDPILLAIEFHYKFIRIHPFDDGNGRTVRILMNFILMQFGYPPVIIKTEDKSNYFSALQQADSGISEPFAEYIASNLCRSLEIMIRGAKGESIEEPDDIDKEISLLEIKLRSLGSKVEKIKSELILMQFCDSTLNGIIDAFLTAASAFDSFYSVKKIQLVMNGWGKEVSSKEDLLFEIYDNLSGDTLGFNIKVIHEELNYVGFEKNNSVLPLTVWFERSIAMIILPDYFHKKIMYSETFSEYDFAEFKRAVKKYGKNIIESVVKGKES